MVLELVPELFPPPVVLEFVPELFPPPVVLEFVPEALPEVMSIINSKLAEQVPSVAVVGNLTTSPGERPELLKLTVITEPFKLACPAEEGINCPIVKDN